MKNIMAVFPGQGSQYIGMGNELQGTSFYEYFEKADEKLEFKLSQICQEGPNEKIKLTHITQPAILTHSIACWEKLKDVLNQKSLKVSTVAGHSVGEYSALVAAGSMSFEDAVKAVHLRGKYMQKAVPDGVGTMYAILKVDQELVERACQEASTNDEMVMPANFNEPNQVVISGHKSACDRAVNWLTNNVEGRFRAVELSVSAPFHCELMRPAEEKLYNHLKSIEINPNKIPYIANVDAMLYQSANADTILDNLKKQVCGSVLWTQTIQKLSDDTICVEVGPGKVLAGLIKKINPNINVFSVDTKESFEKLADEI